MVEATAATVENPDADQVKKDNEEKLHWETAKREFDEERAKLMKLNQSNIV